MSEQQAFFDPKKLNPHQFEPVGSALEGASQYTHGRHTIEGLDDRINDRHAGYRTQLDYRMAEKQPESPNIRRSYGAFRGAVNKQYDFMTKPREEGGMGLRHEAVNFDPYEPSAEGAKAMGEDVKRGVIRTHATTPEESHAYLSPEENDKFRAVHDVFGHAATGRGFDRYGEDVAYLSHRQMFPKKAVQALTSETRGQNTYLNYGPGGHGAGTFPDQSNKLIGLPARASRVRRPRRSV